MNYSGFGGNRSLENLPALTKTNVADAANWKNMKQLEHLHLDSSFGKRSLTATAPAALYSSSAPSTSHGTKNYFLRPLSPTKETKKVSYDLQDQLKMYKKEIDKRDSLISQLTSMSPATSFVRDPVTVYPVPSYETVQHQDTSLRTKFDKLQSELTDSEIKLHERASQLTRQQVELESLRDAQSHQHSIIQALQQKLSEAEEQSRNLQEMHSREGIAMATLQQENKAHQENIMKLESRLRTHFEERDELEQKYSETGHKYQDLLSRVSSILNADAADGFLLGSHDEIINKLGDVVKENAAMHGKIVMLSEALESTERENKSTRDTIMRLSSSISLEQRQENDRAMLMETYKQERDDAIRAKEQSEKDLEYLKTRLNSSQKALADARGDLSSRDGMLSGYQSDMKILETTAHSAQIELRTFKEQLAAILSYDGMSDITPEEHYIKERVKSLASASRDAGSKTHMFEERIKTLKEQLETQCELHQQAAQRAKKAELDVEELRMRLRGAEGELEANDVLREGFHSEKGKYRSFVRTLAEVMRMDSFIQDVEVDGDMLIARAEQLVRSEGDVISDKSTQLYNLQRKVKALKEQLANKDVHLDMIRKKVAKLEENATSRVGIESERGEIVSQNRKLQKQVEKLQKQVADYKMRSSEARAEATDSYSWKHRALEYTKEIERLRQHVQQLDDVRARQAKKITSLKSDVEHTEMEVGQNLMRSDRAVQDLTNEVRALKSHLDQVQMKERQLLDFRQVIARMLGLDVATVAVPDYEIIARLEKLLQGHVYLPPAHPPAMPPNNAWVLPQPEVMRPVHDDPRAAYRMGSPRRLRYTSPSLRRRDNRSY